MASHLSKDLVVVIGVAALFVSLSSVALASHPPDLTGDGQVDQADLTVLAGQWGGTGSGDLNHNGTVNAVDAGILFSSWGSVPPPPPPPPPPPGAGCTQTYSGTVTLTRLDVAVGQVVCFDPNVSTTVQSSGNVVVKGTLRMRPASATVIHTLRFINIDESRFVGGDTEVPLDTDVGLWVIEEGIWDAQGTTKTAWLRTAGGLLKGAASITLASAPTDWRVGDELIITPTVPPSVVNHWDAYDYPTITVISGSTITLSGPLAFDHPAVTVAPGITMTTEVLNMTRNVRVEGQPGKRSHVHFNHAMSKPTVNYVALRYLGPRVLGRYPLHFHHMEDHSRGSTVEGVVIRDSGNSGFVAHVSHGITFKETIGHDVLAELWGIYGWDDPEESHDVIYEDCVASRARSDGATIPAGFDDTRLTAFQTSKGDGNKIFDCVGVGTQGTSKTSSVVLWGEGSGTEGAGSGEWELQRFVGHNARKDIFFTWSNSRNREHLIVGSILYHGGRYGNEHGAYANAFRYENTISYGNAERALALHATSKLADQPLTFIGERYDGNGQAYAAEFITGHVIPDTPVQMVGNTFTNSTLAGAAFTGIAEFGTKKNPYAVDFIDCTFSGNEFWLADTIQPESEIRVRDAVHGSLILRHKDDPRGAFRPEWNAKVEAVNW